MSDVPMREKTLEEVALECGDQHRAAKEYIRIAHGIRMWRECRWWEVFRKRNIKKILIGTIQKIDDTRNEGNPWK